MRGKLQSLVRRWRWIYLFWNVRRQFGEWLRLRPLRGRARLRRWPIRNVGMLL
jgi:hypothetical protein